ncbi:TrmB family transcriptional regulator [Castellaniella sp.]|uniref:TrmB family transcriptional regulator n=1 Tax=Castellaniella sp. TaxID=1955812 RepID=UPI003A94BDDA
MDNDVIDHLKFLGFTEYEARIYLETLRADGSPKTAYEISKLSGVPRSNTYNALEVLMRKGAVLPVTEGPASYIAAAPRDMLNSIAAQTSVVCDRVADCLKNFTPRVQNQYVWVLNGEDIIEAKIEQLLSSSKESIWIKASDTVLRKHTIALKRAAKKKNMRIMIVLFGKDKAEFEFNRNCQVYIHENDGTRMGKADNLFTIVVDFQEMITVNGDRQYIAAHTKSKTIVTMALSLIRHDYYMAEIFQKFGDQISQEFGQYLAKLRLKVYTKEQTESFHEITGLPTS